MRWRGERFVEPGPQITVGQAIHTQARPQIGQAPAETGGPWQITQAEHREPCGPPLSRDRLRRRADDGLALQGLRERREAPLDLPAILVAGGAGGRAEAVLAGEHHQGVARVLADRRDPAQPRRTRVGGTGAGQADGLSRDDVPVLRPRVCLDPLDPGVVLHAGDERDAGIRPCGEQPVGVGAPIITDEGVGRNVPVRGGRDVSHRALGDEAETRQRAVLVEDPMPWDGPRGATARRPVGQRPAQGEHGRIETDQRVLEADRLLAPRLGGNGFEPSVAHRLAPRPGTRALGVRQRGTDRDFDPQGGPAGPRHSSGRLPCPAGSAPGPSGTTPCRRTGSSSTTPCGDIRPPSP